MDPTNLPEQLKTPMIVKAVEILRMISQTPQERERYEARLKAQRDYSSGLKDARLEGILEGILKGKREESQKKLEKLLMSKFGSADRNLLTVSELCLNLRIWTRPLTLFFT